jgi:hypothetical protein
MGCSGACALPTLRFEAAVVTVDRATQWRIRKFSFFTYRSDQLRRSIRIRLLTFALSGKTNGEEIATYRFQEEYATGCFRGTIPNYDYAYVLTIIIKVISYLNVKEGSREIILSYLYRTITLYANLVFRAANHDLLPFAATSRRVTPCRLVQFECHHSCSHDPRLRKSPQLHPSWTSKGSYSMFLN